jgi:hypothetical protein
LGKSEGVWNDVCKVWKADIDFTETPAELMRMLSASMVLLAASAASTASAGPSPTEFAKALTEFTGKPVKVEDIRRLSCEGFDEEPTEAECKWQQRSGKKWARFSTYVAIDGSGWHLIDDPNPIR